MSENQRGCLSHPIWQFLASIAAIIALLLSIFTWFVPNRNQLFSSTPATPTSMVIRMPTATNPPALPSSTPTPVTHKSSPKPSFSWLNVLLIAFAQVFFTSTAIGAITGIVVGIIRRRKLVEYLIAGFIGAFIGGGISELFTHTALLWITIVVALLCSVLAIFILTEV